MDYFYLIAAFVVSVFLGNWTVAYLRKLKMGQEIREEGPKSHYVKAGTPTMGGIFFYCNLCNFLNCIYDI